MVIVQAHKMAAQIAMDEKVNMDYINSMRANGTLMPLFKKSKKQ